ncbi:MAG: hypothetical protein HPAVJP_3890 [Candidatus Hepatoplasma vulgare]|nr:MAG: hypothetical protein HPAVJP_3890 [Candidatus Hepatoplasma sp.]
MNKIKVFYSNKIKKPIGNFINKMDAKVDPNFGKKMYTFSRRMSIFLLLIGLPIITLAIGISSYNYVQGGDVIFSDLAFSLIIGFFWGFLILSYLMWFYFSKWNDLTKEIKAKIREEKREIKENKKAARIADAKEKHIKNKSVNNNLRRNK